MLSAIGTSRACFTLGTQTRGQLRSQGKILEMELETEIIIMAFK